LGRELVQVPHDVFRHHGRHQAVGQKAFERDAKVGEQRKGGEQCPHHGQQRNEAEYGGVSEAGSHLGEIFFLGAAHGVLHNLQGGGGGGPPVATFFRLCQPVHGLSAGNRFG